MPPSSASGRRTRGLSLGHRDETQAARKRDRIIGMDLFPAEASKPEQVELGVRVTLLRGFALKEEAAILDDLDRIIRAAPLRHMVTPGGFRMSVAMTNCGSLGWVSDRKGY